jgi:hypothetical protein
MTETVQTTDATAPSATPMGTNSCCCVNEPARRQDRSGGALGRATCNRRCRSTRREPVTACPPLHDLLVLQDHPTAATLVTQQAVDKARHRGRLATYSARIAKQDHQPEPPPEDGSTFTSRGGTSRTAPPLAGSGRTDPSPVCDPVHRCGPWRLIVAAYSGSHLRTIALRPHSQWSAGAPSMRVTGTGDPL